MPEPDEVTQIAGIEFVPEGVGISYARLPRDVRKNGLQWQHHVLVPLDSDYDEEIEAFRETAYALLADVLDDEDRAEPIEITEPDEEEDDDDDE